jgi:terminase, large subunit
MAQLFKDKKKQQIVKRPAWCSTDLWQSLCNIMDKGTIRLEFAFSRAERKVFRKRKPVKVSKWAEKHRVLTMSVLPGLWHNDVTPYLAGVMDAAALPFVREITLCATPQAGKSEVVHNFVGYCIDRAPGPVLYVYPDEKTAGENSKDRVLPMINASPRLRSYFTGAEKDKSSFRINLQHMMIYFGWGRSVASIANKPIKYAIADEIDKPGFDPGKKETGVIELIDKRLTTFRQVSKFFKISTPTVESGNIWKELNNADIIFDYHVRCPLCSMMQLMDFKGIKWEGGSKADPKEIKNKNLAWYECVHCKGIWDDHTKNKAVQHGVWMARGTKIGMDTYLEKFQPATIGFHIQSWLSYFVAFGEIVAAFLLGLNDPIKMQDFLNSYCALPWKDIVVKQDEEQILAHKNHLPAGVVPESAVALTVGIDVQMAGFWFVVRAWDKELNSHLVQYGYITTWADVENLVFNTRYQIENKDPGVTMGIWRAGIDSGGGKNSDDDWSKTEEVYSWVRKNGRGVVFAIKGASRPQVKKVNPRVIDKMTRGNRVIPGGLTLYFLDVNQFKELFHWRLSRAEDKTQYMSLNADAGIDYARQILAERKEKDRSGKSEWVQIRRDNHLLDCENIAAACADPEWAPSLTFIAKKQKARKRPVSSKKKGFVNSWR